MCLHGLQRRRGGGRAAIRRRRGDTMKGAQKPKRLEKKQAQKTLKERRAEKRAAGGHVPLQRP
jgi:hypothetical protein